MILTKSLFSGKYFTCHTASHSKAGLLLMIMLIPLVWAGVAFPEEIQFEEVAYGITGKRTTAISGQVTAVLAPDFSLQEVERYLLDNNFELLTHFTLGQSTFCLIATSMPVDIAVDFLLKSALFKVVEPNYVFRQSPVHIIEESYSGSLLELPKGDVQLNNAGGPPRADVPNDSHFNEQWGLESSKDVDVDALEAWYITTGSPSVVVAVVDTGVDYEHPDLDDNIWENQTELNGIENVDDDLNGVIDDIHGCYVSPLYGPPPWSGIIKFGDPYMMDDDLQDHGTYVSGIIAAEMNNETDPTQESVVGLAPTVRIMPIKVTTKDPQGTSIWFPWSIAEGISYAVNNNADVINLSLGTEYGFALIAEFFMKAIIEEAERQGVLVVAASGNENLENVSSPAGLDSVIAVGAINEDCVRLDPTNWTFPAGSGSNYGPSLHVVAPGYTIWSTKRRSEITLNHKADTGTSAAAPFVSAIGALIKSIDSSLTPAEMRSIICRSATYIEDPDGNGQISVDEIASLDNPYGKRWNKYTGYGLVNARAAISLAQYPLPPEIVDFYVTAHKDTNIEIEFTEEIDESAIAGNFFITGSSSGEHTYTYSFDYSNYILEIDPDIDFDYEETVTISISTGITDLAGDSLPEPQTFNFDIESDPWSEILIDSITLKNTAGMPQQNWMSEEEGDVEVRVKNLAGDDVHGASVTYEIRKKGTTVPLEGYPKNCGESGTEIGLYVDEYFTAPSNHSLESQEYVLEATADYGDAAPASKEIEFTVNPVQPGHDVHLLGMAWENPKIQEGDTRVDIGEYLRGQHYVKNEGTYTEENVTVRIEILGTDKFIEATYPIGLAPGDSNLAPTIQLSTADLPPNSYEVKCSATVLNDADSLNNSMTFKVYIGDKPMGSDQIPLRSYRLYRRDYFGENDSVTVNQDSYEITIQYTDEGEGSCSVSKSGGPSEFKAVGVSNIYSFDQDDLVIYVHNLSKLSGTQPPQYWLFFEYATYNTEFIPTDPDQIVFRYGGSVTSRVDEVPQSYRGSYDFYLPPGTQMDRAYLVAYMPKIGLPQFGYLIKYWSPYDDRILASTDEGWYGGSLTFVDSFTSVEPGYINDYYVIIPEPSIPSAEYNFLIFQHKAGTIASGELGWLHSIRLIVQDYHDLAVTEIEAPDNVTVGEVPVIGVKIQNKGDVTETDFIVTLQINSPDGHAVAFFKKTAGPLGAGSITIPPVNFDSWDTTTLKSDQGYTITARVSLPTDMQLDNDSNSVICQLLPPPQLQVTANANKSSFLQRESVFITADVTDPSGNPVTEALTTCILVDSAQQEHRKSLVGDPNQPGTYSGILSTPDVVGEFTMIVEASKGGFADGNSLPLFLESVDAPPDTFLVPPSPANDVTLGVRRVEFAWSGVDITTPTKDLMYAYRLDGQGWSAFELATGMVLDLTGGSHTFEIKAKDTNDNEDPNWPQISFFINSFAVSGNITDSLGNPIEGVTVVAGSKSTVSDPNGEYTISDLEPGTYNVNAQVCGYVFTSQEIEIFDSDLYDVNFVGDFVGYYISGRIVSSTGGGVSDVIVNLLDGLGDTLVSGITDSNGYYSFVGLPAASYDVVPFYSRGEFFPASRQVIVPPDRQGVDFLLFNITSYVDNDAFHDLGPNDPNISDPNENGSEEHPFDSIQEAIDTCNDGDTVIVLPGTYTGIGNRDVDYNGKAITVMSTDPNDPNVVAGTVVDCNSEGRGFYFHSGEGGNSVLDGFTITKGYAEHGGGIYCKASSPTITNCILSVNYADGTGGGIFNYGSVENYSPKLKACMFLGNHAYRSGGGMWNMYSSPTVTNCTFRDNSTTGGGGGMNIQDSNPVLVNCTFSHNSAGYYGGGIGCWGSNAELVNCIINNNLAAHLGGGLFCTESNSLTLTDCTFSGNIADTNIGVYYQDMKSFGGGVNCWHSNLIFTNCVFVGNLVKYGGGGIADYNCTSTLTNCTFIGNSAGEKGGGMLNEVSNPILSNCIFSKNYCSNGNGGGINNLDSELFIIECVIEENKTGDNGGGVYFWDSNGIVNNTLIIANSAESGGGGICSYKSRPEITNCTIVSNTAKQSYAVIAHSEMEFSGTQGQDGWYYGYYHPPFTSSNFNEMEFYDGTWHNELYSYRYMLSVVEALPSPTEWVVRRWISDVTGEFTIAGNLAKHNVGMDANDGMTGYIIVDGNEVWSSYIEWDDINGVDYSINIHLEIGSVIDFAIGLYTGSGETLDGEMDFSAIISHYFNPSNGGGVFGDPNGPNLNNCILWDNSCNGDTSEPAQFYSGKPIISYSCLQGLTGVLGGPGNIGINPCFVDPGYWGDVNDPNIIVEPNNPTAVWIDGDYRLLSDSPCIDAGDPDYITDPNETDLDGNPRVIGGRIDMGAYEFQNQIFVDDNALGDPGPDDPSISDPCEDGSWEHPFDAIQEAINAAYNGYIIKVLSGIYTGIGNRDITFLGKAITVCSENGPNTCIIDCQGQGHGFLFVLGEDANSVLNGFTITNGITGYTAWYDGGGVVVYGCTPKLVNCVISNNFSYGNGGGISLSGQANVEIIACRLVSNASVNSGGAISCADQSNLIVKGSLIAGNYAGDIRGGGGVCCYASSSAQISGCSLVGNFAELVGGGISSISDSNVTIINCILWDNTAGLLGNAIYIGPGYSGGMSYGPSTVTISYCDIQNGINSIQVNPICTVNWESGNIDIDPLFANPGYWDFGSLIDGDYHLLPESQCIDAGDPNYPVDTNDFDLDGNPRVIGGRIDMGAYEYNPERFPDLNGDRIVNFKDYAILVYYWMEYICEDPEWCEGSDLNESGAVDLNDLAIFVEHWLEEKPFQFYSNSLDTDPRWATTGEWAYGQPTGNGGIEYGNPDPTTGCTGTNVYGVNLNGDYSNTVGGPYYVTSGPLDCSGYRDVSIKFARWLNTDDPEYVKSTVEASNDGHNWFILWEHNRRPAITDSGWRIVKYDISNVADDQETVYIRWGYEIFEYAYPYSGWNIDDIELWGNPCNGKSY